MVSWKKPVLLMQKGFKAARQIARKVLGIAKPPNNETTNLQNHQSLLLRLPDDLQLETTQPRNYNTTNLQTHQHPPLKLPNDLHFGTKKLANDNTMDPQTRHNPFLELPNELLLEIANLLDQEFQVLLSLSCKRLRLLFESKLELSPCDLSAKIRVLQHLEIDYPEYVTCRSCGFMFLWRRNASLSNICCPLVNIHPLEDTLVSYAWTMQGGLPFRITPEVVRLIFRAQERGQQYGLPLSILSGSGITYSGMTQTNEPRLIDGQLLLASRCEVEAESRQLLAQKAGRFVQAMCIHWPGNIHGREELWQDPEHAVAEITGWEKPRVSKCSFCATDYSISVQSSPGRRMMAVLNVWRNYGRQAENIEMYEQMFHADPSLRISADEVSQRDIRAVFESYESADDTGSHRIC